MWILPSGHILIAGRAAQAGAKLGDFFVPRFTSSGVLDPTFGSGGKVITDFSTSTNFTDDSAVAITVQPDGRIVLAGTTGNEFASDAALARYEPDGTPDTTFGLDGTGRVISDFGTDYEKAGFGAQVDTVNSVALLADGSILVGGSTHSVLANQSLEFLVACYDPAGTLDPRFGTDGVVRTDFGGTNDVVETLRGATEGRDRRHRIYGRHQQPALRCSEIHRPLADGGRARRFTDRSGHRRRVAALRFRTWRR